MPTQFTAKVFPPSPLRPFVDAGVPAEILLEALKVQQRPAVIRSVAMVISAISGAMFAGVFTYDYCAKRTGIFAVPTQQVVQAEDVQKSLPRPSRLP